MSLYSSRSFWVWSRACELNLWLSGEETWSRRWRFAKKWVTQWSSRSWRVKNSAGGKGVVLSIFFNVCLPKLPTLSLYAVSLQSADRRAEGELPGEDGEHVWDVQGRGQRTRLPERHEQPTWWLRACGWVCGGAGESGGVSLLWSLLIDVHQRWLTCETCWWRVGAPSYLAFFIEKTHHDLMMVNARGLLES